METNLSLTPFQGDLARDLGLGRRQNLRDGLFQYKGNLTVVGFGAESNKRHQVFKVMNDDLLSKREIPFCLFLRVKRTEG